MEKKIDFLGISQPAWVVIGITVLTIGGLVICALVAMMFGLNIGDVLSS